MSSEVIDKLQSTIAGWSHIVKDIIAIGQDSIHGEYYLLAKVYGNWHKVKQLTEQDRLILSYGNEIVNNIKTINYIECMNE